MTTAIPGLLDLYGGAYNRPASTGGGGYVSASSSASSGPIGYTPTINVGGIQTGGSQGVNLTTLALIAGAVVLGLLVFRR